MPDVNMPKLSDTMEEGTVLEWKQKDGAEVRRGDVLAEIESDKASFDIEAEADGFLKIVVEQGTPAAVGALIARIGAAGEAEAPAQPEPEQPKAAQEAPAPKVEPRPEPTPERREAPQTATAPAAEETAPLNGVKASPLAKRLARERGVDLASIKGTGPDGRIVKEDVLNADSASAPAAAPAPAPAVPTAAPAAPRPAPVAGNGGGQDVEVIRPSRMQTTIAKRMIESKQQVPHFYITVEARVDDADRLRRQVKETVKGAERVTLTDFLIRASAIALKRHPYANASWVDDHIEQKHFVNIGLAVPPSEGMGLLVPVIHDCDRKDLIQIAIDRAQVIERARSGRPSEGDLSGGTFSISNLGMYGVDEFNAIINPPEAGILA
ncbi:MAG TPA: dihydrolipoamide acetyltransferase family protein, partial [Candidatus Dormibacteraeota bacterium]|nr:dihydrolipoamide acetyltransferase family protein [Candidatus Dormibacteraeota bacterium]